MRDPKVGDLAILYEQNQARSLGVIEKVWADVLHGGHTIEFRIFWSNHYYPENYATYRISTTAPGKRLQIVSNRENGEG